MATQTADLCDEYIDELQVAECIFRNYGKTKAFSGPIATVKVFEDNVLVRDYLEQDGKGRVLVVDGGGSQRCALVGDRLAQLALDNNWAGILVYGCIRDSAEIGKIETGVKAINTCPVKSIKRGEGQQDIQVSFANVDFVPGHYLYADEDGTVVAERKLD